MEKNARIFYEPKKAGFVYRLAAFLIDIILFVILLTGVLYIVSKVIHYDDHYNKLHNRYQEIGYEIVDEENNKSSYIDENDPNYDYVIELYKTDEIINQEEGFINSFLLNGPLLSIALVLFLLEFIIPLILKKGRTVGMLIFHIGLISNNYLKIRNEQLFARAFIGKIVILGLIPYLCLFYSFFKVGGGLVTTIILILLFVVNTSLIIFGKRNASIADLIASVYPVDDKQTIYFNNLNELNQAKKDLKKEQESQKKVY